MLKRLTYIATLCLAFYLCFSGCGTGVEPSPNPGIVRVTLKSNETDTTIIIQNDTSRFSRWDEFNVFVSQGKIVRGENYALLYRDPSIARIPVDTVNILKREWLNGTPITPSDVAEITAKNSRYVRYTIFESYAPPGEYDKLQFNLTANEVLIFIPKNYANPIQLPPGVLPQVEFKRSIQVNEGRVTQIDIEIYPFQSLRRYRDSFLFDRKMEIVGVQNL